MADLAGFPIRPELRVPALQRRQCNKGFIHVIRAGRFDGSGPASVVGYPEQMGHAGAVVRQGEDQAFPFSVRADVHVDTAEAVYGAWRVDDVAEASVNLVQLSRRDHLAQVPAAQRATENVVNMLASEAIPEVVGAALIFYEPDER